MPTSCEHIPVSVVIPCFRCASTIGRAVESIIRQTKTPAEVILIDDASGDDTLAVLQQLAQAHLGWVKVLQMGKNQGVASARNAGWDAATQPYIAFLDADDEWRPEKLDIQYEYMRKDPKIAVTGHQYILLRNSKPILHNLPTPSYKSISSLSLLFRNCFPTSSVMLKSKLPFRFSPGKRSAEDYYLWQQVAFAGLPVIRIETPLVHYYKALYGEGGLSGKLWQMEKGELSNFVALYQSGSINLLLYIAAMGFSITKYFKRLAVAWINQAANVLRQKMKSHEI